MRAFSTSFLSGQLRLRIVACSVLICGAFAASSVEAWAASDIDYDHDGVSEAAGDCRPLDPAVSPLAVDLPAPKPPFEDTDCDGIDGDRDQAIFVSAGTGDDANSGTPENPLKTFSAGLAKAETQRKDVYLARGQYAGVAGIVGVPGIYGGYDPTGFAQRTADPEETKITHSRSAMDISGAKQPRVVLQLLTLRSFVDSSVSRSAYGLRMMSGAKVALERVHVISAPGTNGPFGAAHPILIPGNPGFDGTNADCDGRGGSAGPGGTGFQTGGSGGSAKVFSMLDLKAQGGNQGLGTGGGGGGSGGFGSKTGGTTSPGQPGQDGGDGVAGKGGSRLTNLSSSGVEWIGEPGEAGTSGSGGGGGGAGGSNVFFGQNNSVFFEAGGGGGGAGGPGGAGGRAGGAGGASIGILSAGDANRLLLTGGSIVVYGSGGAGGSGGARQLGATGGAGGQGAPAACGEPAGATGSDGGRGGDGGNGGPGGGGAGGPAFGIFANGDAHVSGLAATVISGGSGGAGGAAAPGGVAGDAGLSAQATDRFGPIADDPLADFDQDGTGDAGDACPLETGSVAGCPTRPPAMPDGDGDGVPDANDACNDNPIATVLPCDVAPITSPAPVSGADQTPPTVSRLRVSPSRVVAGRRGPRRAIRILYSLSEPATVRLRISLTRRGVRDGDRCAAPRVGLLGRRCTRLVTLVRLSHPSLPGANRVKLSRTLSRRLRRAGRYRVNARPIDPAGNRGKPLSTRLRVIAPA